MTEKNAQPQSELVQIVRFFAAALVVVTHSTFYFHERSGTFPVWHLGEIGVPIFFVISGLVIVLSSHKLPLGTVGTRTFLINRFSRIAPLYWVATLVKIAIAITAPSTVLHNHFDVGYALKSIAFIPSFNADGEVRPIHGVGWTLLHEVFFYFVFSIGILIRLNASLFATAIILLCVCTQPYWPRDVAIFEVLTSRNNIYFLFGIAAGNHIQLQMWPRVGDSVKFLVIGMMPLLAMAISPNTDIFKAIGIDFRVYAVGLLIASIPFIKIPVAFRSLLKLGGSSYSLYLFHPFLAPATLLGLKALGINNPWASISLAVTVAIALSHVIHLWIEVPLVPKIKKYLNSNTQSLPGART